MYKSQGVILYIQKIRDSQIRMVIFTEEFGKITCWSKKLVHTDVGNIVSLLIERKGSINSIKSIDTIASLGNIFTNYTEVLSFLSILETLYTLLPESLEQRSIYDDLAKSILMVSEGKRNIEGRDILNIWIVQLFILLQIRILKRLWLLKKELFHISDILTYIYIHIDTKNLQQISIGKILPHACIEKLQEIILQTCHTFHYGL